MKLAPTFIRFGSLEIFNPVDTRTKEKGPSEGLKEKMLPPMLKYLLKYFFTDISDSLDEHK